jgi:hypothetical protein
MEKTNKAFAAIGPSFEELNDEAMLAIDGEITPTVVISAITKVIVTAITGVGVTMTIDKIVGN